MNVTSRDNARVINFCKLRDKSSERAAQNAFTLEGARLIDDAVRENVKIREAFYTEAALKKYPETVGRLSAACESEIFVISEAVAEKMSDTKATQGLFAIAGGLDKSEKSCKIEVGGRFLILNGLQDPGNIGTILRCADAVGLDGVFLCGCCDLYNPKLVRATMGSIFRLNIEKRDYFPLIDEMRSFGITTCAAVVSGEAKSVRDYRFPKNCAAVIGNEGRGLSDKEASACDLNITVKMSGTIESLNAATAATIIMWEMTKEDRG